MHIKISPYICDRLYSLAKKEDQVPSVLATRVFRLGLRTMERCSERAVFALSRKAKKHIQSHPELSHEQLAVSHQVRPEDIKRTRLDFLRQFISSGSWQLTPDAEIAERFGLHVPDVFKERVTVGALRIRGREGKFGQMRPYIIALGGVLAVRTALTEGGKRVAELFRDKRIPITRERCRQICDEIGCASRFLERKPIWYARRLLGDTNEALAKQLTHRAVVKKALITSGSVGAFASKLGVSSGRMHDFIRRTHRHLLDELGDILKGDKTDTLVCTNCKQPFSRPHHIVTHNRKKYPDRNGCFCKRRCFYQWRRGKPRKTDSSGNGHRSPI